MVDVRNAYSILVGKPALERPTHRWDDNIKMNLKGKGCDGVNWIRLGQDVV
jgi:hypothetical protein